MKRYRLGAKKMKSDQYIEVIERFQGKKGLVVGDVMLDEYIWGSVERISPEAPVPVVHVRRESRTIGGAGNVALNVKGLGLQAILVGIVGNDYFGKVVTKVLRENKMPLEGLVYGDGHRTTVKTRIIAHSQQVVRIDREEKDSITGKVYRELMKKINSFSKDVDFIIVSDYNKGAVTEDVYASVIESARKNGIPVLVDPKKKDVSFYRGCYLIKPNMKEAELFSGMEIDGESDLIGAGRKILRRSRSKAVLITRGPEGMTLITRGFDEPLNIPAFTKEVYDVTGAGDTVISTVAAGLAGGADLESACVLSNIAAGVVVGEVGTSPITSEKLRRAVRRVERENYVFAGGNGK